MGKILVADVHATQQTDAVKTALRNYKTELVNVPPGCTSRIHTVGPDHPLFVRIARGLIFSKWRRKSLQRLMGFTILDFSPKVVDFDPIL